MDFPELVKNWLLPGTLGALYIGLALGLTTLCFVRTARAGKWALAMLAAGYLAMSLPQGAWLLGRLVSSGYSSPVGQSGLAGVQAIVVLDGDTRRISAGNIEIAVLTPSSAVRAAEAIRVYHLVKPRLVVVSNGAYVSLGKLPEGEAMREALIAAGVPADHLVLDSKSRNTREHPANVLPILREKGVTRIALVTSAVHMRRALKAFSGSGIQIVPAPALLEAQEINNWRPRTTALDRSLEAWYEVFALLRDLFP